MRRWTQWDVWEESQDRFPEPEPYSEVAAPEISCPDCSILLYPGEEEQHGITQHQAPMTKCRRGLHPFTEENTGRDSKGYRYCRACFRIAQRAGRQRRGGR